MGQQKALGVIACLLKFVYNACIVTVGTRVFNYNNTLSETKITNEGDNKTPSEYQSISGNTSQLLKSSIAGGSQILIKPRTAS